MSEYYVKSGSGDQIIGPYSFMEIKDFYQSGQFSEDDLISKDQKQWDELSSLFNEDSFVLESASTYHEDEAKAEFPGMRAPINHVDRFHQTPSGRYEEIQDLYKDKEGAPIGQALNIVIGVATAYILLAALEYFVFHSFHLVCILITSLSIGLPLWITSQIMKIHGSILHFIFVGVICGLIGQLPMPFIFLNIVLNIAVNLILIKKISGEKIFPKVCILVIIALFFNYIASITLIPALHL